MMWHLMCHFAQKSIDFLPDLVCQTGQFLKKCYSDTVSFEELVKPVSRNRKRLLRGDPPGCIVLLSGLLVKSLLTLFYG